MTATLQTIMRMSACCIPSKVWHLRRLRGLWCRFRQATCLLLAAFECATAGKLARCRLQQLLCCRVCWCSCCCGPEPESMGGRIGRARIAHVLPAAAGKGRLQRLLQSLPVAVCTGGPVEGRFVWATPSRQPGAPQQLLHALATTSGLLLLLPDWVASLDMDWGHPRS